MPGELGFDTGPFVNVAAFCERAIHEKDGVLSLVRVIDQINVETQGLDAPEELPPGALIQTTLVIVLKPGAARGRQSVQVTLEHPDASRHAGPVQSVQFTGGPNNGANIVLQMAIQLSTAGLYWADVMVTDRIVTRVPLEVNYGFTRAPSMGPPVP